MPAKHLSTPSGKRDFKEDKNPPFLCERGVFILSRKTLFKEIDLRDRSRVHAIENGQVIADPIPEQNEAHYLGQRIISFAVYEFVRYPLLLQ